MRLLMALLCVFALGCMAERPRGERAPAAATPTGPGQVVTRHAQLEVHATFWLDVGAAQRAAVIVRQLGEFADAQGGWVQSSSLGENSVQSRITLRVPPASLGALRTLLGRAADGDVRERVEMTDVTDALADLDARLRASRASEARLLSLLEQRTGTLADVIAAENALASIRTQIEQLEATQRATQGRVDEATVEIVLEHGSLAPNGSFGGQAAWAARQGVRSAGQLVVGVVLFALRVLPTLLILGGVMLALVWAARAAQRRATRP